METVGLKGLPLEAIAGSLPTGWNGGHRRLSAVHLTFQCYFTSSFGICQDPFWRFLLASLTLCLYYTSRKEVCQGLFSGVFHSFPSTYGFIIHQGKSSVKYWFLVCWNSWLLLSVGWKTGPWGGASHLGLLPAPGGEIGKLYLSYMSIFLPNCSLFFSYLLDLFYTFV